MKINLKYCIPFLFLLFDCLLSGCQKDFLDKKPDKALLVPKTLQDFQALLDYWDGPMNGLPGLNIIASDELYMEPSSIQSLRKEEARDTYRWDLQNYPGGDSWDWDKPYECIFYANIVLDGLKAADLSGAEGNEIKGAALFYRAIALFGLTQEFAVPYDPQTADKVPGLPIRNDPDVKMIAGRASLKMTYDHILKDLNEAKTLLPDVVRYPTRPSKAAAFALLSRIFMTVGDYEKALESSSKALALKNPLLDYNTLDADAARPFPAWNSHDNPEIIFYASLFGYSFHSSAFSYVDSSLYKSYDKNDLRKVCFFRDRKDNHYTYKGSYSGSAGLFGGLATDELYLIRAECYARRGNVEAALDDLNYLLISRWKSNEYEPYMHTEMGKDEALRLILKERRKELFLRGVRWSDLRRLNADERFSKTLKRELPNGIIELHPGDARYTFLIPENEIVLSGIEQNER